MSAALIPCTRCGDFVDPSTTLLSDAGEPICARCNDLADVDAGEQRAAGAIFAASGSAVTFGTVGCFFNPFLFMTVLGVASAVSTFAVVYRHPEYRARLGWKLPVTLVVAAFGLVLSLLAPLISLAIQVLAR